MARASSSETAMKGCRTVLQQVSIAIASVAGSAIFAAAFFFGLAEREVTWFGMQLERDVDTVLYWLAQGLRAIAALACAIVGFSLFLYG